MARKRGDKRAEWQTQPANLSRRKKKQGAPTLRGGTCHECGKEFGRGYRQRIAGDLVAVFRCDPCYELALTRATREQYRLG